MSWVVRNNDTGLFMIAGREAWATRWGELQDARTFEKKGHATNAVTHRKSRYSYTPQKNLEVLEVELKLKES